MLAVGHKADDLLCKKNIVAKTKGVKTEQSNLTESCKESCSSKGAVFPMLIIIMTKLTYQRRPEDYSYPAWFSWSFLILF
jgi:hypothetical protein